MHTLSNLSLQCLSTECESEWPNEGEVPGQAFLTHQCQWTMAEDHFYPNACLYTAISQERFLHFQIEKKIKRTAFYDVKITWHAYLLVHKQKWWEHIYTHSTVVSVLGHQSRVVPELALMQDLKYLPRNHSLTATTMPSESKLQAWNTRDMKIKDWW